jgi:phospholipid-translocating ATPase
MALSFLMFENTFIDLVTVTFTSLIVIELLNVYSEINHLTLKIALA